MKKLFKLFVLLSVLCALAALSPAPHKGRNMVGTPLTTNEQLEHDQALAKTSAPIGFVDLSPRHEVSRRAANDEDAAAAVSGSPVLQPQNDSDAVNAIAAAEKNIDSNHRSPIKSLFWVVFAGCFGYGIFFAFRRWADKALPEPGQLAR